MPSASRHLARFASLAVCGLLLVGAVAGCSTTQEKAALQQAQSKHILDARAERQRKKHADRPKTHAQGGKSADRPSNGSE